LALQRRFRDNPVEIAAIGCTRESEAQRRGKWALLTNSRNRGITFSVGMDGRIPLPGYVIPVADSLVAGREIGGRIAAVSGLTITLDRDTAAKAGDLLILNLPAGTCEGRTVQSVSGRQITVTTAYSVTPLPELVWCLDADDLAVPLYRVTSVSRPSTGVFEITAIQYDPSKFDFIDTGAKLETRPISVIPISVVPPPASVALTSNTAVAQGLAVTTMTIDWPAVAGAVAYDVQWRKDSGNWISLPRTGTASVDVVGIYAGAYLAQVRAVSAFDISSVWRSSVLTQLNGKEGAPPAVTTLTAASLLFGIGLKWTFPAGAEDTQRTEIWYGPTPVIGAATKLSDLSYPQADYVLQNLQAGATFYFWARLVDRTGNIGPYYPTGNGVQGIASTDAGLILNQIAGQIGETELGQSLLSRIDLIDGPASLAGSVADRIQDLNDQVTDITSDLQTQINDIGDIADSAAYDPTKAYTVGQSVIFTDGILYQAKGSVPAGSAPPDATYWTNVGQAVSDASGLAARVTTAETSITDIQGVNAAQTTSINGLQSSLTGKADASALNSLTTRVTSAEGSITSQGQSITGLTNTVAGKADASALTALTTRVTSAEGVNTSQGTAITNLTNSVSTKADASTVTALTNRVTTAEGSISSQGSAITTLTGRVTNTETNITGATTAISALDQRVTSVDGAVQAQAAATQSLNASVRGGDDEGALAAAMQAWTSAASISQESTARATSDLAIATTTTQLQASINTTNAVVQTVSTAQAASDGLAAASWQVKMQVNSLGQYVAAGIGLGIANTAAGLQSQFLVSADRFAVINGTDTTLSSPFAVQGGQVFINSAFIQTASIGVAKLTTSLQSANYVAGQTGLIINFATGVFELNAALGGGGRQTINNAGGKVYDASGVKRYQWGDLSV
jgi:predicted phage tail protein